MLLADLRQLLAACAPDALPGDYRAAVVEHNVLAKATTANRRETYQRLRQFYALDPSILIFRALRHLWNADETAQPLLALLCVAARDTVVRVTIDFVLDTPEGSVLTPLVAEAVIQEAFPDHYGAKTLKSMGQHILGTWAQAGHLRGVIVKTRAHATATPAATAYALLLGHLWGARGGALFETLWARLLDCSPGEMDALAFAASQRGWINYRRVGPVIEVEFPALLSLLEATHG